MKAQYQLGFVRRTFDGKWSTPNGNYSYNIKWLQKAADAGHKSAAARLAEIGYKLVKLPTVDIE